MPNTLVPDTQTQLPLLTHIPTYLSPTSCYQHWILWSLQHHVCRVQITWCRQAFPNLIQQHQILQ